MAMPRLQDPPKTATVFLGRETAVSRDQVSQISPSVESDLSLDGSEIADDLSRVTSDIASKGDEKKTGIRRRGKAKRGKSATGTSSEGNGAPSKDSPSSALSDEDQSNEDQPESPTKTPESPPPKRRRTTGQMAVTSPRRSARNHLVSPAKPESTTKRPFKKGVGRPPAKRGPGRPPKAKKADPPPTGEEWEVEKIVNSQIDAHTHEHFYRVKWKGFPAKDNTWEPKKNLEHCLQAIRDFEKESKKKR